MRGRVKVVIVIPCRSGSKRIPDKNFQKVGGKTLISRAVRAAAAIAPTVGRYEIDKQVIVASDSENHERVVSELQSLTGPILVMERTCAPDGPSTDVVANVIEQCGDDGGFDVVCLVQCTSPFIRPQDIEGCIRGVLEYGHDRVRTAIRDSATFYGEDRNVSWLRESGACYALGTRFSIETLQSKTYWTGYYVDPMRSMEIDEPHELELANIIAEAKGW